MSKRDQQQSNLAVLHAQQFENIQKMNSKWAYDQEINRLQHLAANYSHTQILSPTGIADMGRKATALSEHDVILLSNMMLSSNVKNIFIIQNTGNHWYPIVLNKNSEGVWQACKINTRADGSCGPDTVAQCEQILKQGFELYEKNNARKIAAVNPEEMSQIKKVFDIFNPSSAPHKKSSSATTLVDDKLDQKLSEAEQLKTWTQQAIKLSQAAENISVFDLELAKLAEYEHAGNIQAAKISQSALANMLGNMDEKQLNKAVTRLVESKLNLKESIQQVIDKGLAIYAARPGVQNVKLFENRHILMPLPTDVQSRSKSDSAVLSVVQPAVSPRS